MPTTTPEAPPIPRPSPRGAGRRIACAATVAAALLAACGSGAAGSAADPRAPSTACSPDGPLITACDTTTPDAVTLNGAGANSIEPFFARVFYDYHQANPKTTVNYSPAGSSVGITDIEQGTVDFGDTEIPMAATDLAKASAGTVLQIPVDLGGVAISYNVPGAPDGLRLDGPTLAAIFDGSITNWDDPRLAGVSGVPGLPNLPVVAVHRADSSGPGWDLDDYLIETAPGWGKEIGTSRPSKTWPLPSVGIGQQLNTGVASYVQQTAGAIGYVEYGYSLEANFDNVALRNQAGAFVAPSLASIAAAGAQATGLSPANFSIIDGPGAGTYPLANFSWTLLYQRQASSDKGIAAGRLFDYVVTDGQRRASSLGYAPLPANVVQLAIQTLQRLQSPAGTALFIS